MICYSCRREVTPRYETGKCPKCGLPYDTYPNMQALAYSFVKQKDYESASRVYLGIKKIYKESRDDNIGLIYQHLSGGLDEAKKRLTDDFNDINTNIKKSITKITESPKYIYFNKITGMINTSILTKMFEALNVVFREYSDNILLKLSSFKEFYEGYNYYMSHAQFKEKEKHREILFIGRDYKNYFKELLITMFQNSKKLILRDFFNKFHAEANLKKLYLKKYYVIFGFVLLIPTIGLSIMAMIGYHIFLNYQLLAIDNVVKDSTQQIVPFYNYNSKYKNEWLLEYKAYVTLFDNIINVDRICNKITKGN